MARSAYFVFLVATLLLAGCRREERDYRPAAPFSPEVRFQEYEKNAFNLSEGKRLFVAFNCQGCHGYGGGGMGPPLMDEKWIYGAEPGQIFDTISRGRPNGMPAFGGSPREPAITLAGNLPDHQRWQLVAYVRSLSGLADKDAAPGRDDHMSGNPPENERPKENPVIAPPPPEMPK